MPIRTYCDYCNNEIKGDEGGVLKTLEPSSILSSSGLPKQTLEPVAKFLCQSCIDKLNKTLKK